MPFSFNIKYYKDLEANILCFGAKNLQILKLFLREMSMSILQVLCCLSKLFFFLNNRQLNCRWKCRLLGCLIFSVIVRKMGKFNHPYYTAARWYNQIIKYNYPYKIINLNKPLSFFNGNQMRKLQSTLCQKCPYSVFVFLLRGFPNSNWIRRDTEYNFCMTSLLVLTILKRFSRRQNTKYQILLL